MQGNNTITWRNHIWMTAILAGIASSFMITSEMSSTPNFLSILFFMSSALKTGLAVISAACAIIILVRHAFLKQRQNDLYQKICYACIFIIFVLAMLLVFCRIQKLDKRDSEVMQAVKLIGNTFGSLYVTIIRGTPMMVQGLIVYYAGFRLVRSLFPGMSVSQLNQIYSVFLASAVTVSLNTAAYITEILRGFVEAIEKGQTEAARSLGLIPWQTMMKVIFPQAIRNSIPAICNEFIININDTSVLNAVGMTELMFMTTTVAGTYYVYLETYMITAVIYLILTIALQAVMNFFAKRMDMPVQHGVPSSN